jgi:hypothetical protein
MKINLLVLGICWAVLLSGTGCAFTSSSVPEPFVSLEVLRQCAEDSESIPDWKWGETREDYFHVINDFRAGNVRDRALRALSQMMDIEQEVPACFVEWRWGGGVDYHGMLITRSGRVTWVTVDGDTEYISQIRSKGTSREMLLHIIDNAKPRSFAGKEGCKDHDIVFFTMWQNGKRRVYCAHNLLGDENDTPVGVYETSREDMRFVADTALSVLRECNPIFE